MNAPNTKHAHTIPIVICIVIGMLLFAAMLVGGFCYAIHVTTTDFKSRANDATTVVEDVYRYRHTHGLWPQHLEDASTRDIARGWVYVWPAYDTDIGPTLRLRGPLHMKLEYRFPPIPQPRGQVDRNWQREGWVFSCEGDRSPMNVGQAVPVFEPWSDEELQRRVREELQRRIEREPEIELHQDALKWLGNDGPS